MLEKDIRETFKQLPSLLGRQREHSFPSLHRNKLNMNQFCCISNIRFSKEHLTQHSYILSDFFFVTFFYVLLCLLKLLASERSISWKWMEDFALSLMLHLVVCCYIYIYIASNECKALSGERAKLRDRENLSNHYLTLVPY